MNGDQMTIGLGAVSPAISNLPEFTISELSFALKRTVEEQVEHVRVRGEVSGFRGCRALRRQRSSLSGMSAIFAR
jgi:hypothetical protein